MRTGFKSILVTAGAAVVLWFSAPLLFALVLSMQARLHYQVTRPQKVATLPVRDAGMTVALWTKAQPRAKGDAGEYRILEVRSPGRPARFYTLGPRFPGEPAALALFWLPDQQKIRVETNSLESVIDVKNGTVLHVDRQNPAGVFTSQSFTAAEGLSFPPFGARYSSRHIPFADASERAMWRRTGGHQYQWIFLPSENAPVEAPVGGTLVGRLDFP